MRLRGFSSHRRVANTSISAVLGALFVVVAGCSSGGAATIPQAPATAQIDVAALAESSTFGDLAAARPDPAPQEVTNGVVLRVKRDSPVHDAPNGVPFAKLPATQLNNPTWVPIIAERGDWAQVLLPSRPNSSTGWIRVGNSERFEKARTSYVVDVDIDARRMVISDRGREIGSWKVGVGASDNPTPRGRTFIMASIKETVTRFSPIILPLGTHSETLSSYGGGPGTVALHGWPDPGVFGQAASDGCVRVPDDALRLLTSLPLGTLVLLR